MNFPGMPGPLWVHPQWGNVQPQQYWSQGGSPMQSPRLTIPSSPHANSAPFFAAGGSSWQGPPLPISGSTQAFSIQPMAGPPKYASHGGSSPPPQNHRSASRSASATNSRDASPAPLRPAKTRERERATPPPLATVTGAASSSPLTLHVAQGAPNFTIRAGGKWHTNGGVSPEAVSAILESRWTESEIIRTTANTSMDKSHDLRTWKVETPPESRREERFEPLPAALFESPRNSRRQEKQIGILKAAQRGSWSEDSVEGSRDVRAERDDNFREVRKDERDCVAASVEGSPKLWHSPESKTVERTYFLSPPVESPKAWTAGRGKVDSPESRGNVWELAAISVHSSIDSKIDDTFFPTVTDRERQLDEGVRFPPR